MRARSSRGHFLRWMRMTGAWSGDSTPMAIQVQGNGGTILEVDGATFRAARVTGRPLEYTTGGHYRFSGVTGTIAAALAANAQVFQFKWTSATLLAVIQMVRWKVMPLTPFTAATLTDHT